MNSAELLRATYSFAPVDHLYRREFYIWDEALLRWESEGMPPVARIDKEAAIHQPGEYPLEALAELFGFDEPGDYPIGMLGWCEPAFYPPLEARLIETTDRYDIVRDEAGRTVRFKKGQRHGFMPTYLKHAVAGDRDWEEDISPLLDPGTPGRWAGWPVTLDGIQAASVQGKFLSQRIIGGYMYLRALIGPSELCLMFVDNPQLIHKMMQSWLALADAVTVRVQQHVVLDEVFLAEDICYNHGLLVSPAMVREFLLPYYQQLVANLRSRQQGKRLHVQVDSDGYVHDAIDLYLEMGMDCMSPFEVAAGNDLLALAEKYPNLVMSGGIDKRVLALGPKAIDEHLKRILPPMVRRGGYIPTCDHGVPDNVSYANYLHYRKRMLEWDHY
jgi:uroporphyrinogen decarboxylase